MGKQDLTEFEREGADPGLLTRNLKLLRKRKGISQQQLAEMLGLKRNNIASYESGAVEPSPRRFLALAQFFDVDPVLLLTKDLSEYSADQLSMKESLLQKETLANEFDSFISKTIDLQKVIEGFKVFYEVKKQQQTKDDPILNSLSNDFENLLEILEKLLATNWDLINALKE